MRWSAGIGRRLAAATVAVSMSGVPVCFGQTVRSAGTLTGRIFLADGVTPRSGVVVKVANLSTSQVFASTQTDRSGHYALSTLPSGQYEVAVEAGEGLYVSQERVPVIQGRKTLYSFALNPTQAQDNPPGQEPPPPPPPPPQDQPPQTQPPAQEPPPAEGAKPEEKKPEEKKPEDKGKTPAEQEAGQAKKKSGGGFWRSGWGVAIGLGGGAIVLGLLADSIAGNSSEVPPPPSASTP